MTENKKVTIMLLKVDLQCQKCYKKVKKVLCKFPQIRDQTYDEKKNMVIIKVVCCSPEKIRDKLCCKGGDAIKSIEIQDPPKTTPPEKKTAPPEKKTTPPEKKTTPPESKTTQPENKTTPPEKKITPPEKKTPPPDYGRPIAIPSNTCCSDCYHGRPGGPCYSGYGALGPTPYIQYDGYYGRPIYDSYGGGVPGNCVTHSQCFSEENPQACSIM